MHTKLSANREIDDYVKEDSFDFKPKADAIKSFLEYNVEDLKKNKMIALYGSWGSGKTSLMKYIEKEIDKSIYFPIFFHAWEHEKDENLALSLCDAITDSLEGNMTQQLYEFKKTAFDVLKSFTSGVNIKVGGTYFGAEVEFDGGKMMEALIKAKEEKSSHSFFAKNKIFKEKFQAIEQLIIKNSKASKIIVFVDDLDRCEPENVLNLITALKLFFTFGENTIFLAGLDKDAVNKAVTTKYQDVIKSEEYLEKVFDITFSIPKIFSLDKYLSSYFKGSITLEDDGLEHNYPSIIGLFFYSIHFTTPRHIKKVLNKYEILKAFKKNKETPQEIKDLIPNLLTSDGKGDIFETIFCLFFIVLYENYPEEFYRIEHYKRKMSNYYQPFINANPGIVDKSSNNIHMQLGQYIINDFDKFSLNTLFVNYTKSNSRVFTKFLILLSTDKVEFFGNLQDSRIIEYSNYFPDNSILSLFCKFLIKYHLPITNNDFSKYIFWNYFKMAKYLL